MVLILHLLRQATLHESAWSTVQDAPTKLLASIEMMKTAVEGSLEGFHRTLSAAGEPGTRATCASPAAHVMLLLLLLAPACCCRYCCR